MQQSLAWTNWPLFTVGLVQRGCSDDDIQKILGDSILRVSRQVFAAGTLSRSMACASQP
jgi:membrane dipeptidase